MNTHHAHFSRLKESLTSTPIEAKDIQRYKNKSVPQLLKILERHFNKFIRERDSKDGYFICISCQKKLPTSQMSAGHFYPTTYSVHRFNEDNVHGQCLFSCNKMKSGNLNEYRINLIKKIGEEKVKWLDENRHAKVKWDRYTLIDLITKYK